MEIIMKTYEELFGSNLQRLRLDSGLSQSRLGDLLGFSGKAISKWECGKAIPDISTLYKLSDIFGVRLDDFFANDSKYYLGIDGGGTKTAFVLADEEMNIVRRETLDCTNPIDIGIELAKDRLREGINRICRGIPASRISIFAGIAGGSSSNNRALFRTFFSEFGFAAYDCDTDNRNIIAAGLGKSNGLSVILGTGFCVFRQKDGKMRRFAGWGYLFDGGASGYNIGRDGLSVHFNYLDGIGEKTMISELILAEGKDGQILLGELYAGGKREVATYAATVYTAARAGDKTAEQIIKSNMAFAAKMIEAAAKELTEERIPVVLAGGLTKDRETLDYLNEALTEPQKYDIKVLPCEPVIGALAIAKELREEKKEKPM